jgi:putative transposase
MKTICDTLQVSRSNQYAYPTARPKRYHKADDGDVLREVLQVTTNRGTDGYRRVRARINRRRRLHKLPTVSKNKIQRLMQIYKLVLPKCGSRKERPHTGKVITMRSNLRYCSDILEIHCWDGKQVHVAFSLDCHDREAMAYVMRPRDLTHHEIIELMDRTVTHRYGESIEKLPQPIQWLTDNGGQYVAEETRQYGEEWGFEVINTPAYSPESNGMAEAFVKLFKRDYVYANDLWTAESVMRMIPGWFDDYNREHPHSGLDFKSPWEYRNDVRLDQPVSV